MLQHKAFKFRIYPNHEQAVQLRKTLGCCRFVFNHLLAKWNHTYQDTGKGLSYSTCASQLPAMKREWTWLKEVDSIALQSAVRNLADGFQRFINKQNESPRFKSRKHLVHSYTTRYTNGNIAVKGDRLQLPKLGWMPYAKSREIEGRILSATVRLAPSGKWFVSVVCEVDILPLPLTDGILGIDVGIKQLAVTSEGLAMDNPRYTLRYERLLAKWQRILARRKQGGSNWSMAKRKVAQIHERIRNSRLDVIHKQTTRWIRENQTICIEDLRIANMMKNRHLVKHIADASWGEMSRQLHYKANWYGRVIKETPTFAPTSQTCHVCGNKQAEVKDLSIRVWKCSSCQTVHDRDRNAAQNIKAMAL
ncbi:IS200/IS605 family element RNA-guided endonuclease TnpB [Paenibacillus sp. LHD-117]|uniref:IS200/IS605 family element RNA-guided endonuclease TnpB n=1 Tax=Paenibacillus sp. LHD-117 TaxID=3071412 RepID=UPI0027E143F1|nr:IS200/IS605 family element RNA-guided endonuclease TnpB [Paenibacillus sp. LHD-117]MDQ6421706.1 IS200/IS605 family element RNA-guided endonuclease TnpB [Paenibacillus sp. LHD-117]